MGDMQVKRNAHLCILFCAFDNLFNQFAALCNMFLVRHRLDSLQLGCLALMFSAMPCNLYALWLVVTDGTTLVTGT